MPNLLASRNARLFACLALVLALPRAAHAQGVVAGVVRDSARGTPLADALVLIQSGAGARSTRSEQDGAFQLRNVPAGTYRLTIRRLGYREATMEFHALDRDTTLVLTLARAAQQLDTMRANAHVAGIFGTVGTSAELRPLSNATVQVIGTGRTVTTDSSGRFFVDIKKPGMYMVRVNHDGYFGRLLSITVPDDHSVETVPLLDATDASYHASDRMWKEFDQRAQFGGADAAIIAGAELRKGYAEALTDAINFVPATERHGLRIGNTTCVFVNGIPRPGWSVDQFDAEDIDAIELYTAHGDATGTLDRLWPRTSGCARSIRTVQIPTASVAKYAVIWLKAD
jgi:hypothetical protein